MLTLDQYWMGRDKEYPLMLSTQTRKNAAITVDLINRFLIIAKVSNVLLPTRPDNGSLVNSGWRPAAVNADTPGASKSSLHITGQAIDLYDPTGAIDKWCMVAPKAIIDIGLWQEHPDSTPGWCHLQTLPPHSGNRVFRP
jgi:hypothetical protein